MKVQAELLTRVRKIKTGKKISLGPAKNAGVIGKSDGLSRLHSDYGPSGKKVQARLDKEGMIV